MNEVRHLSVSIAQIPDVAYAFLSEPANFPKWASGLGSLAQVNGAWVAQTPDGPMPVRFSGKNPYGILDHWVSPKSGPGIHIPMRVIANGEGSELLFTLFRQPDMDDRKFDADAEWVMRDLEKAKRILEGLVPA
jgi:hypothetical protein